MLDILRNSGYKLPAKESSEDLTAADILAKIEEFVSRCLKDKNYKDLDLAEDFLQLLTTYPVSMCKHHMTPTFKRLMAMYYFYRLPRFRSSDKDHDEMLRLLHEKHEGWFSYETLAILFLRSKSTVHDVILDQQEEVKALLEEPNRRAEAREIARIELIQEEKMNLLREKHKGNQQTKQTNPPS